MTSLILMCMFLIIAVLGRMTIQYRRTGDYGVRAAPVNSPLVEILPGTLFILTFSFAVCLVVLGYMGLVDEQIYLPLYVDYIGFFIGIVGIGIVVISQLQMGDSWRIGTNQKEQTTLITQGLYTKSRNPIYFGIHIFWLGLIATFTHTLILASALICWVCIEVIVRYIEEPYLYREHGQAFTNYVDRTNRYCLL